MLRLSLLLFFPTASAFAAESALPLQPIFQLKVVDGKQRFGPSNEFAGGEFKTQIERVAFMAVCTNVWLPGLVPIFGIEKSNRFELRRRPLRGQEAATEPLFFALPLEDDALALALAGRWEIDATRNDSRVDLAFELAVETNAVAGRFDQYTEYRFAYLAGGSFISNALHLRVEYISDVYLLTASLADGKLVGDWRRDDLSEVGTWQASREPAIVPGSTNTIKLHEWRRGQQRRYALDGENLPADWQRSPRPLARVWRPSFDR